MPIKFINCELNIPKKYAHMLREVEYEGREDGYWAYLNDGFASENGYGSQTLHEDSKQQLLKAIRQCVAI